MKRGITQIKKCNAPFLVRLEQFENIVIEIVILMICMFVPIWVYRVGIKKSIVERLRETEI